MAILKNAAINEARIGYNPADDTLRGLLIEEQRTNTLKHSEAVDNAVWNKAGSTISANATTAPDGNSTADKIVEDSSTAGHNAAQAVAGDQTGAWCWSVFVSAAERSGVRLLLNGTGDANSFAVVEWNDFTAGAAPDLATFSSEVSGGGAHWKDVGNGWYRVSISCTQLNSVDDGDITLAVGPILPDGSHSYAGDGNSGIYVWGAQIENGPFPSSYISTTTAAVTRAADNVTSAIVGGMPNSYSYDITATPGRDQNAVLYQVDDGTENNRVRLERIAGSLHYIVTSAGVEQVNLNLGALADFTEFTVRCRVVANDFAASLNGAASSTDAVGSVPAGLTTRRLGSDTNGNYWNGWIKDSVEVPRALNNADLEA